MNRKGFPREALLLYFQCRAAGRAALSPQHPANVRRSRPPLAVPKSNAAKDQIPSSAGEAGGGNDDSPVTAGEGRGSIIFIKYADFVISER